MNNDIKVLVDNVFAEANNLEFIVMFDCKLETIQRFAFNGLTKIRRIYLHQNRISTLHSQTFSQLSNLNYISLSGNTCIDKTFVNANQKFVEIENEISKFCKLSLNNENLTNKWKTYDEKLNNSDAIIQDLIKTIKNLQEAMKYLEQNCTNSTSLIQLMKDQKEEIYNTCECQNNLIDVRFNN